MTDKKKQNIISACTFAAFFALALLFPYTGDDWDWGSIIGMERLSNWFADYNGRYIGNLLEILLTRHKLLDALCMAACYTLCCRFSAKYAPRGDRASLLFSTVLFLLMPREIFAQSVVWTAGFVNYVPSALISVGYLLLVKNAGEEPLGPVSGGFLAGTFLMGFCGALFMENITLFNICLGVMVAVYLGFRHRKLPLGYLGFPAGAVLGCILMFANSGYRVIAQGEDFYRQTPQGILDTVKFMAGNMEKILNSLILDNWVMCLALSGLLVALLIRKQKAENRKFRLSAVLHLISLGLVCVGAATESLVRGANLSEQMELLVQIAVAAVCCVPYIVTVFALGWFLVDKEHRLRLLLPLLCVPVCMAPLLVVKPIGARCMFPGYLLLMVFATALFDHVRATCPMVEKREKQIRLIAAVLSAVLLVCCFAVYYPVHIRDREMNAYAKEQSAAGATVIRITNLSDNGYVHCSYPYNDIWWNRYCLFHGLNTETYFELISADQLLEEARQ